MPPSQRRRDAPAAGAPIRGRGAPDNPAGRFRTRERTPELEAWHCGEETPPASPQTSLRAERSRSVLSFNRSPDIPFDRSLNPYRGCEHGCIYCYARPSHAYLDLSPGLDFETKLTFKPDAPERLAEELARADYRPAPIALGMNTDAWQPVERRVRLTRRVLEVLYEHRHPVTVITKSALIERDLDLLVALAEENLVSAAVSITTLDDDLNRRLEPRAAGGKRRLRIVQALAGAAVPVGVMIAPVIPVLNDSELERIVASASDHGAGWANYTTLRLPYEVRALFEGWLQAHYPRRAEHVLSVIRQMNGGRAYASAFGERMRGTGAFADLLEQRIRIAVKRHGLAARGPELTRERFRVPVRAGDQLSLL